MQIFEGFFCVQTVWKLLKSLVMFLRFSSGDNFGADSFQRNSFSFLLKEQAKRRFRRFWSGSLFYPLEAGFIFRLCHFPSHLSKAHRIVIAGHCFFRKRAIVIMIMTMRIAMITTTLVVSNKHVLSEGTP